MIISIDGPSGAGKSTLGRLLARRLNLLYIDTGAMYRAVALAVIESGVSTTDAQAVAEIAKRAQVELDGDPDSLRVTLDGRDVTGEIRHEAVGQVASVISTISEVRRELVERQRELGNKSGGAVLDGRDIGTVVFPKADVKFFLTATPEQRAGRRYEQQHEHEKSLHYEEVLHDINRRDERDQTRADSPLKIADDCVVFDTTELTVEDVLERMLHVIDERRERARR